MALSAEKRVEERTREEARARRVLKARRLRGAGRRPRWLLIALVLAAPIIAGVAVMVAWPSFTGANAPVRAEVPSPVEADASVPRVSFEGSSVPDATIAAEISESSEVDLVTAAEPAPAPSVTPLAPEAGAPRTEVVAASANAPETLDADEASVTECDPQPGLSAGEIATASGGACASAPGAAVEGGG
jgi:hypothetical protein